MKILLLLQAGSTLFMVGLIWFVQIVHYPMFDGVGEKQFSAYEARHQRLTTYVVMPVMLVELATAIALVPYSEPNSRLLPWVALILLAVIWLSTWLLQVPAHTALMSGFSPEHYRHLVNSNWIRTIAWTVRGGILAAILARNMSAS